MTSVSATIARDNQPTSDLGQGAFAVKAKVVRFLTVVAFTALAAYQTSSANAETMYSILNSQSDQGGYTVSGQIGVADGTSFGTLLASNVSSWSFSVTNGTNTYAASSTDSGAFGDFASYIGVSVHEDGIYLSNSGYTFSLKGTGDRSLSWLNGSFKSFKANETPLSAYMFVAYPVFTTDATYGWLIASPIPSAVPEIDPATGGSALSLAAGVLAMIEQRRRRVAASRA